jgi:transcriptional regulator with XRE-family HTH domain
MDDPEQAHHGRERLSAVLRLLRATAGLTSEKAAARAGFSQSKLSKIENGLLLPSEADVRALCRAYSATTSQRDEAIDLLRRLRNESASARVILQRGAYRKQREIGRVEVETTMFRDFQPTYVLGLLQTRAYMRRVFASMADDDAERAMEARIARQGVLRDGAKRFHLIMTEGALRWRVGSPDVMIAQLDHIGEVAKLPNVRIGMIPWTTEASVFPGHAFHIYDDSLVIVGTVSATAAIRDPRDIALYVDLFTKLQELAADPDSTVTELRRIRTEYKRLI